MGLFSNFFKPKVGDESKETISKLRQWIRTHFPDSGYTYYSKPSGNAYRVYRTDSGSQLKLSGIQVPLIQLNHDTGFFASVRNAFFGYKRPMLPTFLIDYHNKIHQEIIRFEDNLKKLSCLSSSIREDDLFLEIDHVFNTRLKILYNELLFCKFDKLGESSYFSGLFRRINAVYGDMQNLNTDFSDYMYAMTNTEYENTKQDLEMIRMRVTAMSDVAKQQSDL